MTFFLPVNRHSCTQSNHEGIQSGGGSRGFCCYALHLFHLQPALQTQRYLDPGSILQSRNTNTGVESHTESTLWIINESEWEQITDYLYFIPTTAFGKMNNHFKLKHIKPVHVSKVWAALTSRWLCMTMDRWLKTPPSLAGWVLQVNALCC